MSGIHRKEQKSTMISTYIYDNTCIYGRNRDSIGDMTITDESEDKLAKRFSRKEKYAFVEEIDDSNDGYQ